MTLALPELWSDWCAVTGRPADTLDEPGLTLFSRQTRASASVLRTLRRLLAGPESDEDAPAWPRALRDAPDALSALLRSTGRLAADPGLQWISRIRLKRLRYAAVLLAPRAQGGLSLHRTAAAALTPRDLKRELPTLGIGDAVSSCPTCTVATWLDVLSANSNWSRLGVREQATQAQPQDAPHVHESASSSWADWPDHPNLLPAIDRWGYLDRYGSLHRSSLSGIIRSFEELIAAAPPVDDTPVVVDPPRPQVHRLSADEVDEILARADELNARASQIIADHR